MAYNKTDKSDSPMRRKGGITGNCAKHQRALTVAIKRARHIALMPYVMD